VAILTGSVNARWGLGGDSITACGVKVAVNTTMTDPLALAQIRARLRSSLRLQKLWGQEAISGSCLGCWGAEQVQEHCPVLLAVELRSGEVRPPRPVLPPRAFPSHQVQVHCQVWLAQALTPVNASLLCCCVLPGQFPGRAAA
jgi:hypothetical protein